MPIASRTKGRIRKGGEGERNMKVRERDGRLKQLVLIPRSNFSGRLADKEWKGWRWGKVEGKGRRHEEVPIAILVEADRSRLVKRATFTPRRLAVRSRDAAHPASSVKIASPFFSPSPVPFSLSLSRLRETSRPYSSSVRFFSAESCSSRHRAPFTESKIAL